MLSTWSFWQQQAAITRHGDRVRPIFSLVKQSSRSKDVWIFFYAFSPMSKGLTWTFTFDFLRIYLVSFSFYFPSSYRRFLFSFLFDTYWQRDTRLHGARSIVQRNSLRFERRLVQFRLHAVQTAQRAFAVPAAQDERQARD